MASALTLNASRVVERTKSLLATSDVLRTDLQETIMRSWAIHKQDFRIRGSSDPPSEPPDNLLFRERTRQAIERKRIPNREPDRFGGGAGAGHVCSVCERVVTTKETDLELFFTRDGKRGPTVYHAHARCYSAWIRTLRDGSDGLSRNP